MSRNIRSIPLALFLILVSAPAAQALPLDALPRVGIIARVLSWFDSFPSMSGLTPVIEQEGSSMDPNGQPQGNNWSTSTTDEGSSMDPNGRS